MKELGFIRLLYTTAYIQPASALFVTSNSANAKNCFKSVPCLSHCYLRSYPIDPRVLVLDFYQWPERSPLESRNVLPMAKTSESGLWDQDPPVRASFCCAQERHADAYVLHTPDGRVVDFFFISRIAGFVREVDELGRRL